MTSTLIITYLDICQRLEEASQHYSKTAETIDTNKGNRRQRQENLRCFAVILAEDMKENKPLVVDGVKGKSAVPIHLPLEQIAEELGVPIGTVKSYLHSISTYTHVTYKVSIAA